MKKMEVLLDVRRDARKIISVLLVLLVANVLFFLGLVYPRVRETASLLSEKESFESDLTAARKETEALRVDYERITSQEQGLRTFYDEILGTKQRKLVEIEREIATIAKEFNIDPEEVRYETEQVPEGRVERFQIVLPLQGDYQNLRRFIARVENSDNFLVIDRIALSGAKEGGSQLQLNVQIGTYFDAPWLAELQRVRRPGAPGRRPGAA